MNHEEHEYKGIKIYLMRIRERLGWFANINNVPCGTYVTITPFLNDPIEEKDLREHFNILLQNAEESIDLILSKK